MATNLAPLQASALISSANCTGCHLANVFWRPLRSLCLEVRFLGRRQRHIDLTLNHLNHSFKVENIKETTNVLTLLHTRPRRLSCTP